MILRNIFSFILPLSFYSPRIVGGEGETQLGIRRTDRDIHRRKQISQEAVDKIIYDVLSSDKGLAALATGENVSGGFGSSTKGLFAQDLAVKLAGEIATLTADDYTTESGKEKTKTDRIKGGFSTVICTELAVQGRLPLDLYQHPRAFEHFNSLPLNTRAGYWIWANRLVPLMRKSPRLSALLAPIAIARYKFIICENFSVIGWASVYIAQPICYMIGACLPKVMRKSYGQS